MKPQLNHLMSMMKEEYQIRNNTIKRRWRKKSSPMRRGIYPTRHIDRKKSKEDYVSQTHDACWPTRDAFDDHVLFFYYPIFHCYFSKRSTQGRFSKSSRSFQNPIFLISIVLHYYQGNNYVDPCVALWSNKQDLIRIGCGIPN